MDEDDRPWTEAQWEEFMKHADLRSARYGELMETLFDHPERDAIVSREMGWEHKHDDDADMTWAAELEQGDAEAAEEAPEFDDDDDEDDPEAPAGTQQSAFDELRERDEKLKSIPAYSLALSIAVRMIDALHPHKNDEDLDEELLEAMLHSNIAAAKIAGGHAMGYEDQVIGGNVVNCKRALAAARECRTALLAIRDRQLLPADLAVDLVDENARLIPLIEQHIESLRARMWWQDP